MPAKPEPTKMCRDVEIDNQIGEFFSENNLWPIHLALKEIENTSFHFSGRRELNDSIEGYIRVFWKGDKPAWEGLFKNYVCSLFLGIEYYLLCAERAAIANDAAFYNMLRFDSVPMEDIIQKLGDEFIKNPNVQKFAAYPYIIRNKIYSLAYIFAYIEGMFAEFF